MQLKFVCALSSNNVLDAIDKFPIRVNIIIQSNNTCNCGKVCVDNKKDCEVYECDGVYVKGMDHNI